MNAKQYKN